MFLFFSFTCFNRKRFCCIKFYRKIFYYLIIESFMNKDPYTYSFAWFFNLISHIVIWSLKRVTIYVFIIGPCFWETSNAEIEFKRQVKLLKGFKTCLSFACLDARRRTTVLNIFYIRVVFIINKAFLSNKWQRFKTCVGCQF